MNADPINAEPAACRVHPRELGRPDLILPTGLSCLALDLRAGNTTIWVMAPPAPGAADGGPTS